MTPGTLIAQMRHDCGLTQTDLARRSGVPRTAINAYERGTRVPTATTLLRLAEACDMSLTPTARPAVDLERNAEALEQVLDLAELLPSRPRKRLEFPALASA
jgi:transcriptional regulator with XRE-family HTH domain